MHVPFCRKRCPYCSFYSVVYREDLEEWFLEFLKKASKNLPFSWETPKTLYIGGGTPSVLSTKALEELFCFIHGFFGESFLEATFEANPESLSVERLKLLKDLGVGRISIGVQSFKDRFLKFLGRIHSGKRAMEVVEAAISMGFSVSIDLIFGMGDQSEKDVEEDVKVAYSFGVHHVSIYGLTIEEGTEFFKRGIQVNDEVYSRLYLKARDTLEDLGYTFYEISNASRPGKECLHNINYWLHGSYIGVGPSAVSFSRKEKARFTCISKDGKPLFQREDLNDKALKMERIFLLLRTRFGLPLEEIERSKMDVVKGLVEEGLCEVKGDRLVLTKKGALLANEIAVRLL